MTWNPLALPPRVDARICLFRLAVLGILILLPIGGSTFAQTFPLGDELTIIQKPLLNIPAFARPGDVFPINCEADPATTGWTAELVHKDKTVSLNLLSSSYDASTLWWTLQAEVPAEMIYELYDLRVMADGGIDDTTWNAVNIIPEYRNNYYFIHVTDPHMPDHQFSSSGAVPADSTESVDMREVIRDINLLNPEFVLLTGDVINEGELEDYLEWRSFSRVQHLLTELEVPVFLVTGNHDVGGWDSTPPPDGTARIQWWRFFGWARLDDPPVGAPYFTQNYSFDYGPVHFIGMESYLNYDDWRDWIYGDESFTSAQMNWLDQDLAASGSGTQVMFFHSDFSRQLNLNSLDVEMALSGHIHYDSGSLNGPPWDLTTDNVCDGARSYRTIKVSGSTLSPQETQQAGSSGQELTVSYNPANDGTNESVIATIDSSHDIRHENGRLRIRMPKVAGASYDATGGTLLQVDDSGDEAVCHVAVDIPANRHLTVTVTMTTGSPVPDAVAPLAVQLLPNYPNPFNPSTNIVFSLSRQEAVHLSIYDMSGRFIALLEDGIRPAGVNEVSWSGLNSSDQPVPSGVYLVQLQVGDESKVRRIVLAK
ncbi:MAG: metallophosphoesterase [Gemmatimonadales bacterium]|nr:metallophosphoesterase [Gemmatimonadales bacterium]